MRDQLKKLVEQLEDWNKRTDNNRDLTMKEIKELSYILDQMSKFNG